MIFIKINNLTTSGGRCDYKGLNIDLIVPGSQVYPSFEDVAYFQYDGDTETHPDIEVLTQSQYQTVVDAERNKPVPKTEVELLREQLAAQDAKTDQAIMELTMLIAMGGIY